MLKHIGAIHLRRHKIRNIFIYARIHKHARGELRDNRLRRPCRQPFGHVIINLRQRHFRHVLSVICQSHKITILMIIFYKVTLLCGSVSFFYQTIGALSTVDLYKFSCIFILNHSWMLTFVKILKYSIIHKIFYLGVTATRSGFPAYTVRSPIPNARNRVAINLRFAQMGKYFFL